LTRFPYIDALRGYAILGVIFAHVASSSPPPYDILQRIASAGARGVQLFFVTSAIALMFAWRSHNNGIKSFFIRRFFRIAPMFWLAIPATYVARLVFLPNGNASWDQIVATAMFLHGLSPHWLNFAIEGNWTIAVEATFYMLFPIFAVNITNLRRAIIGFCFSLALAAAAWPTLRFLAEAYGSSVAKNFAFMSFSMQAPCFMIGIATFFLIRLTKIPQWAPPAAGILSLMSIAVLSVVTTSVLPYVGFALAFGAAAYSLANRPSLFVNPVICWIGTISYSAYFWHFLIIKTLAPLHLDFTFLSLVTLGVTCALSTATYLLIEDPMIVLGSRLSRSSKLEKFSFIG
jgi:exopolysaccharide production protein ExoZ